MKNSIQESIRNLSIAIHAGLECVPGDILDYQPDPEGTETEDDIYAD